MRGKVIAPPILRSGIKRASLESPSVGVKARIILKPKTKEVNHESNPIIGYGLSHRVVVSRVCGTGVIQQHVGPKDTQE